MSFQTHSISIQLTEILCLFLSMLAANSSIGVDSQAYSLQGELKMWHTINLDFKGPDTSETATDPNPFLDYRLQVQFRSSSGRLHNVPGFYDGDGQGRGTGNIWRVCFSPSEAGKWFFVASFRKGSQVAVSLDA